MSDLDHFFSTLEVAEGPRYLMVPPGVYVKIEKGHEPEFYVLSEETGPNGLQEKLKAPPEEEAAAREWLKRLQKKISVAAVGDMAIAKGRPPAPTTTLGVKPQLNQKLNRAQRREALRAMAKKRKHL